MNKQIWNKCKCIRIASPESPLMKKYLMVMIKFRRPFSAGTWVEMDITLITMEKMPPTVNVLIGGGVTYTSACIYRVGDGIAMMWNKRFFSDHYPFINPMHRIADGR